MGRHLMNVKIDANVTFELNNDRKASLDAYQLYQFHQRTWAEKCLKDADGKPLLNKDDRHEITLDAIISETTSFVKESCQIDLAPSEAIAIFNNATSAWESVQKNWQRPTGASESLPPSLDQRYSE